MKKSHGLWAVLCLGYALSAAGGCGHKDTQPLPAELADKSREYFERAVDAYRDTIKQDPRNDQTRLALGRLYYAHGMYEKAREALGAVESEEAYKIHAFSLYREGKFRDALDIFNRQDIDDAEYQLYHGLTAEKLNLHDQALRAYRAINDGAWRDRAQERIEAMEKDRIAGAHIKDMDPSTYELIARSPEAEEYPEAGALILSCDEKVEITRDDKEISTFHYLVKILNERGKEDFSETHISYDSTFERVELLFARTIRPDGTVVDVGTRHIRDVSRYLNFPLYSNVRVYIISFPEVAKDAVIEYGVKIHNNRLINKKDFVMSYTVQSREPIIDCAFTVVLPDDRTLHVKTLNEKYNTFGAELSPQIETKENFKAYRWRFKDIPQIIPEPSMPAMAEINPAIILSTFSDWQDVYSWWSGLVKDKTEADAAIRDAVKRLVEGRQTDEEKIRALYHYCAQDIRYVAVEYGQAGYEPHKAADIFKNKYGDCKDQAVLLITMLREAGLRAWPVLISTRDYLDLQEDFPSVLFNHAIAAVELGGALVFLDPTAETCPFGDLPPSDQNRRVLVFKEKGSSIERTPLFAPGHNLIKHDLRIVLHPDESISAHKDVYAAGVYAQSQRYWLLYTQPELVQQALKEGIQQITLGGRLNDYQIDNLKELDKPMVLRYSFQGPEYLMHAGTLRIMPQLVSLDTALVALQKRSYPLDFAFADLKESEYVIELPPGFTIQYMPSGIKEDSPWFTYELSYTHDNARLRVHQKGSFITTNVPVEEYAAFKEFYERLAKKIKEAVVLERKE